MEVQLRITGSILIAISLVHIIFPKYFDWKNDLSALSLINRQLMYVHTFFVGLIVFLMGLLCVCCATDLLHTDLGHKLCMGLCAFWSVRLFFQFFVYTSKLWKGKLFETTVHIVFSILWSYISIVFFLAATV